MVALKTYKPLDLNVNPMAIANQLATPFDYNGTLNAIQEWNKLANNEAIRAQQEIKAKEDQDAFDLKKKKDEAVKAQVEAGVDPLAIDYMKINRDVGDFQALAKMKADQEKATRDAEDRRLKIQKDLTSIGKANPEYATILADEYNLNGFRAPKQETGDGKPDKPKPVKPQTWVNIGDGTSTIVDANSISETAQAKARGFIPQKDYESGVNSGLFQPKSAETPEAGPGLFERMFNSATGQATPAATPGPAAISKPPPGHLLVRDKATGEIKIVKK